MVLHSWRCVFLPKCRLRGGGKYAIMAVLCECVLKKSFKEILEDFIKTKLSLDNTFVKKVDDDSFPKAIKGKKEYKFLNLLEFD